MLPVDKTPSITIGATGTLKHFFNRASLSKQAAELWICSPFFDNQSQQVNSVLGSLAHSKVALFILTSDKRTAGVAGRSMANFPWKKIEVAYATNLHAKIYFFSVQRGDQLCVIGSHNFTENGLSKNFESGVFMASNGNDDLQTFVGETLVSLKERFRTATKMDLGGPLK